MKVLVVDDTPEVRRFVKILLSSKGLKVVAAESGQRALDVLASEQPGGEPFDAVLADYMMPMSGIELLVQVVSRFPGLPVFIYSAAMDMRLQDELTRAGARAVFDKEVVSASGIRLLVQAFEQLALDRAPSPRPSDGAATDQPTAIPAVLSAAEMVLVGRRAVQGLRHEAHALIESLRDSPDPQRDLTRVSERVREFYTHARTHCEALLQARTRAQEGDPNDGRRTKHLVLERIGNAAAILETAIAEIRIDPMQSRELARASFIEAEEMLAHFLDMLGILERAWGLSPPSPENGSAH